MASLAQLFADIGVESTDQSAQPAPPPRWLDAVSRGDLGSLFNTAGTLKGGVGADPTYAPGNLGGYTVPSSGRAVSDAEIAQAMAAAAAANPQPAPEAPAPGAGTPASAQTGWVQDPTNGLNIWLQNGVPTGYMNPSTGKLEPFMPGEDPVVAAARIKAQADILAKQMDLAARQAGGGRGRGGVGAAVGMSPADQIAVYQQTQGATAEAQMQNALVRAQQEADASKAAAEIKAQAERDAAQIAADTSKTNKQKDVEIGQISAQAARDAAEATAKATRYAAELAAQQKQAEVKANIAIAAGNVQLGFAQMASSERIAAARAAVDREIAGLNAYTQLLGFQEQGRARKAEAAASVFKTLAEQAPADQLRSAFFFLRGQAPPPTLSERMPAGLLRALDINPDTANAAAQTLRGDATPPPFLAELMRGQAGRPAQPAGAMAGA